MNQCRFGICTSWLFSLPCWLQIWWNFKLCELNVLAVYFCILHFIKSFKSFATICLCYALYCVKQRTSNWKLFMGFPKTCLRITITQQGCGAIWSSIILANLVKIHEIDFKAHTIYILHILSLWSNQIDIFSKLIDGIW